MASLEGEGACLGKFNEAPLDQFGEGSRGGVLGRHSVAASRTDKASAPLFRPL
jgi:hypothetical protein